MNIRSGSIRQLMHVNAHRFEQVDGAMDADLQAAAIRRNYEMHQWQTSAGISDWDVGNPYDIADWAAVLTPVEFGAWQDIRASGLPLWPRLQVGELVVSFGNPAAKVALQCGVERDGIGIRELRADHWLKQIGWRVFRVPHERCLCVMDTPADVRESTGECSEAYRARYLAETLAGAAQELRHAMIAAGVRI